jgi:hypothetical protein
MPVYVERGGVARDDGGKSRLPISHRQLGSTHGYPLYQNVIAGTKIGVVMAWAELAETSEV